MSKESNRSIPRGASFPLEVRLAAVRDFLSGKGTKAEIALRYNISYPRTIDKWVRQFGPKELSLAKNKSQMTHTSPKESKEKGDRELALEREISMLRDQLRASQREKEEFEIRANALDTMIDIAESVLDIQIRKKSGAKQ